jgi:ribonuclease P protein component
MSNRFPKHSKLCGQLRIAALYKEGERFVAWPLRVTWQKTSDSHSQILVWAPKSLFKKAVQRNHLRRLMREAYRLNQGIFTDSVHGQQSYRIAFNYMDKEEQPYQTIEKAVCKALRKIAGK